MEEERSRRAKDFYGRGRSLPEAGEIIGSAGC